MDRHSEIPLPIIQDQQAYGSCGLPGDYGGQRAHASYELQVLPEDRLAVTRYVMKFREGNK